jgi:hypothetical protein
MAFKPASSAGHSTSARRELARLQGGITAHIERSSRRHGR